MPSLKKAMDAVLGEKLSTKVRHGVYSAIRSAVTTFSRADRGYGDRFATPDSEEARIAGAGQRVRFGGTKPMFEYTDSDERQWLYKKAINCVGFRKREGALLTEAGSKLQEAIDPGTSVKAFARGIDAHGYGSFQQKIDLPPHGQRIDLFKWQKGEAGSKVTDENLAGLTSQILREHTTDWLLCNFDTKGENFLVDTQGRVRGIDKEQAFSYINRPGAQHMSKDFRPNPNDTLYNVMFSKYANNEIDLDLDSCMEAVKKVESMSGGDYMNIYKGFWDEKFKGRPADDPERQAVERSILERKQNIRGEYETFFTGLINERCEKLNPEEQRALREKYLMDKTDGKFRFPDTREWLLNAEGNVQKTLTEQQARGSARHDGFDGLDEPGEPAARVSMSLEDFQAETLGLSSAGSSSAQSPSLTGISPSKSSSSVKQPPRFDLSLE